IAPSSSASACSSARPESSPTAEHRADRGPIRPCPADMQKSGMDQPEGRSPRFYVEGALRAGGSGVLGEASAHHALHVLRLKAGDAVTLFNGRGGEYAGRIASAHKLEIRVDVLAHRDVERESPLHVVLVQGVSSGERMDFTIRKAVELGVA